jgi:O-antigen/teichoic acid export membrane protein
MQNKVGNTFLKSILKFSVGSWIQAAMAFISVPIITRAFSPEEYGKINMFTLAVSIAAIFVGLSLDQSYFRFFKENATEDLRKKMLTQFIGICSINYIFFLFFNIAFGKYLSIYLFGEFNYLIIYLAFPLMVVTTIILSFQSIYFRMTEDALRYGLLSILTVFSTKFMMIFASIFHATYSLAIIFTVAGGTILVSGFILISKKSFEINLPIINIKQIKPYLKYSLPLVPVAIIVFFNTAILRFLIKDYLSYTALGIFTASITVAGLLSLIQMGFTTYWTPFMYANYEHENLLIKRIHSGLCFLMISFSLLIILLSDIIFLVLGEEYRSGKSIFAMLLISPVVITISETTCFGIYINRKTYLQLYCTIFSFFTNIILGFILVPRYGILGAALTNAIGGIVFYLSRTYYGLKEYNSAENLFRTQSAICILILASLINYWIQEIIIRSILITMLLLIILIMYKDILVKFRTLSLRYVKYYKG